VTRRAFNAFCAFCASVAALMLAVWMMSFVVHLHFESQQGSIFMQFSVPGGAGKADQAYKVPGVSITAISTSKPRPWRSYLVVARYWFLLACCAVAPALWLLRRAWPKHRTGLCSHCGYDLRATPGRCPECGTSAPAAR